MELIRIKSILALLLCAWLPAVPRLARGSDEARTPSLTREQWRQDLQFLAKELPRRHKNAFHATPREAFDRAIADLDAAIPLLQEHEIIVGMTRIVAMVGDAHTAMDEPRTFHRYPLSLYWFGKELRVTLTTAPYRRALGTRVAQIGELSVDEAAKRISSLIPHENEYWVRYLSALYLPYAEMLHALKVSPDLKRAKWEFVDDKGERFALEMEAVSREVKNDWLSTLNQPPLYRQRQNEPIWFTSLTEAQTVYVNLRGNPDNETFGRVAGELFKTFDNFPVKRLVVDLRLNRGGDLNKVRRFLLPKLKERSAFHKPGSVFVIIGRATQSAAMVNAIDFRRELNATLVGEPTGGRPNGYSENDEFRLPNSKLEVSYSTRYYKFQEKDSPAVMPDKLIEPSWDSYPSGRDSVMEWILAQPFSK